MQDVGAYREGWKNGFQKDAQEFSLICMLVAVRVQEFTGVLYELDSLFADHFAERLHLTAEFGACVFGDAGEGGLHLAALVGDGFDFLAEGGGDGFQFAAEIGARGLDSFSGVDVHICNSVF